MPETTPKDARPRVQMLDFRREFSVIREEVLAAIEAVCDSQQFILGPEVERFEKAAARACAVRYAAGCASGTEALWLTMAALKIGPSDAVVTSPFSFFATVSSILRAGAYPLLADIDPKTFNLNPAAVEAELSRGETAGLRRVAAIMPVHLYGQCADMDSFTNLAQRYDLKIVEDAAQAFGASWNGVRAGGLGNAAAFSFYPTKNLSAMGDAGMVTTQSAETDERVRMFRTHGMRRRYFHDEIGWNARMDTIQAAVLDVKLKRLDAGNARRREIAALYGKLFRDARLGGHTVADGVVLPWVDPRAEHVFHQYVIRAPRRDALRAFLADEGVGSEIYYPLPLHLQESLAFLGYKKGDLLESERAAEEVLALPIHPELREDEVETVVDAVRRFYS